MKKEEIEKRKEMKKEKKWKIKVKDNENEKIMSAKDRIRTIIDYFEQEIYTHSFS